MAKAKPKIGKTRTKSKKSTPLKGGVPRSAVEHIVPIPSIDVYSELPFALVERDGERISLGASDMKTSKTKSAKPTSTKTQQVTAPANRPVKIAAKKSKTSART